MMLHANISVHLNWLVFKLKKCVSGSIVKGLPLMRENLLISNLCNTLLSRAKASCSRSSGSTLPVLLKWAYFMHEALRELFHYISPLSGCSAPDFEPNLSIWASAFFLKPSFSFVEPSLILMPQFFPQTSIPKDRSSILVSSVFSEFQQMSQPNERTSYLPWCHLPRSPNVTSS